jgi:2-keto-4-pentenoate hydratase
VSPLDPATHRELGERLYQAERERQPLAPLTEGYQDMTAADAYAVQRVTVGLRQAAGEQVLGYKVGLTSKPMQQLLGVDQPDHGPILSAMLLPDGSEVPAAELIQPRVEAEIAFLLARPLRGPGVTATEVLRASAGVVAALEIADSRIRDWQVKLADTIADMASSARVVLGGRLAPLDGIDPRLIEVVLERGGEPVATGAGAACLGHPANAVAWAANTLGPLGVTLEAGHVIMPGALHPAVPAEAGDTFRAVFDRLGPVTARFV